MLRLAYLDAREDLSIQVHPYDEYARAHENDEGKTESWYILEADKGATLVLENCPYSHLPKGHMSIQIVKAIKSDYLKLLWDPANSYRAYKENVPAEYLTFSLEEELHYIYPWIDHIHIKDYAYNAALEKPFQHVAFDMGDIRLHDDFFQSAKIRI